ncbi:MAG: acetyl-CoA carboxylase biotin carboxyl carrier protein subunit [Bacteroidetes bacterium]|nr:acetyl-CoA carboxylase biotin carboxyl carrier protein subunit [Bacteroidota bacterium]
MPKKEKEEKIRYNSLVVDGVKYKTLLTQKFINRPIFKEKDPGMVKAFIPGTILKVRVKKGKRVKEGDLLLILEAMKMRNVVASPVDGVIRKVLAKAGDRVSKNQLMIEIDHEFKS